jgi:hypothetical protein
MCQAAKTLRATGRAFRAAPVLAIFLIMVTVAAAIGHSALVKEWRAMYPSDPTQRTALQLCYIENHQFLRWNAKARDACYEKWLPILAFRARFEEP